MPNLPHHRRHHSWPHCGSELCRRAPSNLEIRMLKPSDQGSKTQQLFFQQAAAIPLIAEEPINDDADMAGIVRTPSRGMHRLWSRPQKSSGWNEIPASASTAEARKHVHRSVLRRLIRRPPLDKTRSLFVMPTMMNAGDQVMISGWMPSRLSARPVMVTDKRGTFSVTDSPQFVSERRHRRSHSEQPRAWREPSASLWTLKEE
ncbi:hypothetical protein N7456_009394 [Penicillium angulare]|uniref:Uncharacterized protein n=1 Tax=Penicillium angulare TaxID=116970 RepID=A0A9W9F4J4_9EURO|nr:hypothetical protein N7456_009394 [Penicillium angulare]